METESPRAEDAKEATDGGASEEMNPDGIVGGPPTKGHRDHILDIEWVTQRAYGSISKGHPGREEGKGCRYGNKGCSRKEEYYSQHPAHDYTEDAPEHGGQTTPDQGRQEAAWTQANAGPEASYQPPYPQESRAPREAQ